MTKSLVCYVCIREPEQRKTAIVNTASNCDPKTGHQAGFFIAYTAFPSSVAQQPMPGMEEKCWGVKLGATWHATCSSLLSAQAILMGFPLPCVMRSRVHHYVWHTLGQIWDAHLQCLNVHQLTIITQTSLAVFMRVTGCFLLRGLKFDIYLAHTLKQILHSWSAWLRKNQLPVRTYVNIDMKTT